MKGYWGLIGVNAAILGCFGILAAYQQNFEFLYYLGVVTVIATLILTTTRAVGYPKPLLWAVSVWGWMHMAGGTVPVGDNILYDTVLIPLIGAPFHIVRYDQLIHLYGSFLVALLSWHLLKDHLSGSAFTKALVVLLVALGLGAVNEVIEFIAVLTIEQTYVGDYYNIALDLVANLLGAGAAAVWVYQTESK